MRKTLLVTLTISALAIAGCKHAPMSAPRTTFAPAAPIETLAFNCKNNGAGNKHKERPVVCVSLLPGGAYVDPLVIPAAAFDDLDNKNKIRFIGRPAVGTSPSFKIQMKKAGCVVETEVDCSRGDCELSVLENIPKGTKCAYTVILTRIETEGTFEIRLDPIVIIDTN